MAVSLDRSEPGDHFFDAYAKQLDRIWLSPPWCAVPSDWRLSVDIHIGVASGNIKKIQAVSEEVSAFGGKQVSSKRPLEHEIKSALADDLPFDDLRVGQIARVKSLFTFPQNSELTHAIGLDTDTIILGQKHMGPLGIPQSGEALLAMLHQVSGQTIRIETAAAFADLSLKRVVAFDAVTILLKLPPLTIEDIKYLLDSGVAGAYAGGIDYSNALVKPILDSTSSVVVNRVNYDIHDTLDTLSEKLAFLPPNLVPSVLGTYVKGWPSPLIRWVIYNGMTCPVPYPIM